MLYAYISHRNNLEGGKWTVVIWIVGIVQIWPIVSRISKNLVVDGLLYDSLMACAYLITLGLLGRFKQFSSINYAGIVLIVLGIILSRYKV